MKVLILEDEENIRTALNNMLRELCPDVEVVAEASNKEEALLSLARHRPELLMLDIQIEGGTSFDLLDEIDSSQYQIIFITAYDHYAIEAFKYSAIDYLLKPIDPDELQMAVERARHYQQIQGSRHQIGLLMDQIKGNSHAKKMVLKTAESIHLVAMKDIIRCEAHGNYCTFHMYDGEKIMVSRTLKDFDKMLAMKGFYRIHHAHLVNIDHIKKYHKTEGGTLIMQDGSQLPVAVRKKGALLELLEQL